MATEPQLVKSIKHPAVAAARAGTVRDGDAPAFLVDGHRLVERALEARAEIDSLFFLKPMEEAEEALRERAADAGVPCFLARKGVFFKVLDLGYETSVRVLASVRRPPSGDVRDRIGPHTAVLVGESIQDPRNVGVMIRTADAWDDTCAVFSADSADPYSRAAVRSTTGSIFRVPPVLADDLPGYLRMLKEVGVRVIGSSARAGRPCRDADLTGACALVLGNESVGMSKDAAAACDETVTVPMRGGGADSLNVTVAAGILLYERARQRAEGA